MIDTMKTGAFIRNARKNKGMSQEKLGSLLHVSKAAVSKWETGKGFPDVSILPDLSQILDVSIEELVTGEKKEIKSDPVPMENLIEVSVKEKKGKTKRILFAAIFIIIFIILVSAVFIQKESQLHLNQEMADELQSENTVPRLRIPVIHYGNSALMRTENIGDEGTISEEDVKAAFDSCSYPGSISNPQLMQNIRADYIQQILSLTETSQKPSDTSKLLILDSGNNILTLYDNGIVKIQNGSRIQYFLLNMNQFNEFQDTITRNIREMYQPDQSCQIQLKGE